MSRKLFTSESVTEGHPDKLCDQISDALLDQYLKNDSNSRVAIETMATTGVVIVAGEVTSNSSVDVNKTVREVVNDIGFNDSKIGFDGNTCSVMTVLQKQSADIALGVDNATDTNHEEELDKIGAGDQGLMFGYACDETEEYMPLAITLAHKLTKQLTDARKSGKLNWLRPDGKSQVTVEYIDGMPKRVDTVLISTQHDEDVSNDEIFNGVLEEVIKKAVPAKLMDKDTKIFVNPTGRFVIGGPNGDTGLTGRKIIVDTYGGTCPHGGGALSGKDATKVDRSALYMTRYVAKNLVAAGLAKQCQLQVSYAIGRAKPVSLNVDTFGTGVMSDEDIEKIVEKVFDFRPLAIIKKLGLNQPIFRKTSNYGHLGNPDFAWEKLDKVEEIKKAMSK